MVLVYLLRILSKTLSYNNLVNHIVDNFVGFDINPIAVIQSKGNYILSLGDITQLDAPMSIPIYMCDSILVPTVHAKQKENGNIIEIETSVGKFILPILKDRIESDKFLKTLSTCILNDYSTFEEFEGRLQNEEDIELKEEDRQIARKLFCQLQVLHSCSKDGFWPIILKNSFAPLFSKKHFDYVMGNPPWIAWKPCLKVIENLLWIFGFRMAYLRKAHTIKKQAMMILQWQ